VFARRISTSALKTALAVLALTAGASCAAQAPTAQAPTGSGTTSTLDDLACLTASRCFAVGDAGTVLATSDGGRIWHREPSPVKAPLYRIACVAPSSCYAIARPATIVMTHDAGAHWTAHTLPIHVPGLALAGCVIGDGSNPQGETPCRLGLLDIACPSASVCYAVATAPGGYSPVAQAAGASAGSSLWLTRDGGSAWTRQSIPAGVVCDGDCSQPYGYPLEWVACAASNQCWAGGNQLVGSHEGFAAALLTTSAPGRSWRLVPGCPAHGGPCSEPVTDVAACPTSAGCYAVNNSSPFGDGSTVTRYTATGHNGPSVSAPSGLVIDDIACPAAHTCYTVGAGGVILRTTTGTRFTPVKSPTRHTLNAITCVSTSACYAVGVDGTIVALHEG
jgi:hypothetical protein